MVGSVAENTFQFGALRIVGYHRLRLKKCAIALGTGPQDDFKIFTLGPPLCREAAKKFQHRSTECHIRSRDELYGARLPPWHKGIELGDIMAKLEIVRGGG